MQVRVFWVGKTRLPGVAALTEEYSRRLGRYCEFRVEEIRAARRKVRAMPGEEEAILARSTGSYRVVLDPSGQQWTSAEFTRFLRDRRDGGSQGASFCVGGAEGFSRPFRQEANLLLSLSPLTLPHELAHIVFREFVGFENARVPRWLDEGVAQYAEVGRREAAWGIMRAWLAQGLYIPLDQLNALRLGHASGGTAHVFYTQAVTLVHFFLAAYGPKRFIDFCSNLRDGYSVERALSFATASSIASLGALEDAWRAFLLSDF